ncbi:DUF6011 domain-containing protein [Mycobacterium colombiense]|uniref:DUF6011 domain-containing protein n=1 Tax=Mycobacterium colombiense TaxID=339268 RepID=UPI00344496D8
MRPKTRKRPAPAQDGPSRNYTNSNQFTAPWRQEPHEPLTPEDRADLDVLVAAAERGFRLATRCLRCGQWLVAPSSVRTHLGPVCRSKTDGAR